MHSARRLTAKLIRLGLIAGCVTIGLPTLVGAASQPASAATITLIGQAKAFQSTRSASPILPCTPSTRARPI